MKNVYIVGPSCGGKTSLLHYLRKASGTDINFPIRAVSRPPRSVDDQLENVFLSQEEFVRLRETQDSQFFISWHRLMEDTRKEYYGFRRKDVSDEKINVFSGNNALILYPDSHIPRDVLEAHDSYFIACIAPDELRKERLKTRSPEYKDAEVQVRIYQESIDAFLPGLDLVIDTSEGSIEENGRKALDFIKSL